MGADDVLRETFEAYAGRAPSGRPLADAARKRHAVRRRARVTVAGAAAATALVATGTVALTSSGQQPRPPVTSPAPPPPPPPPADTRFESWGGLQVAVPAGMPANAIRCTEPTEDTILVGEILYLLCMAPPVPGLTVAHLQPASGWENAQREYSGVESESLTLDGHPARRVTATARDGRHVVGVVVDGIAAAFWVVSPDLDRAEALVAAVRVVDVDHQGCPAKVPATYAPRPERAGAHQAMVPGTPVEASACRYDGTGRLTASLRVRPGDLLSDLVTELGSLEPGFTDPAPSWSSDCRKSPAEPIVLTFRYASGPDLGVWVQISGCAELGASNGAVHGRLRPSFLELMSRRLVGTPSYWTGWTKESPTP